MALKKGETSWVAKLPPELGLHARRLILQIGLDGLRQIADALPPRKLPGRPAIDREAEVIMVLERQLVTPNADFQVVARRLHREGRITPRDRNGHPVNVTFLEKDLSRRLAKLMEVDPLYQRKIAERLAREGKLVRDDLFDDIYDQQIAAYIAQVRPPRFKVPIMDLKTIYKFMSDQTDRLKHFRAAFNHVLPNVVTIKQLSDTFQAAEALVRADVDMRSRNIE